MTKITTPAMGKPICTLLGAVALTAMSLPANAGGIDYLQQSDYGLLLSPNNGVEFGGTVVVPNRKFKNVRRNPHTTGGLQNSLANAGIALDNSSTSTGNIAESFVLPEVSVKYSLTDDLGCMGSIRYPYGTHQDAGDDWEGRYYAIETEITSISYNLDCAYSFDAGDSRISLIGGVRTETSDALLSQATSGAAILGSAGNTLAAAGLLLGYSLGGDPKDSLTTLKADSTEFGFTTGIAVDLPEYRFKIRAIYQSEIEHNYVGTQTINVNPTVAGIIGTDTIVRTGSAKIVTSPQNVQVNASKQFDNGWGVLGFVRWVDWSSVESLDFSTDDNSINSSTGLNWKDGWTYGFGVSKLISPKLAVYGVLAYDKDTSEDATRSIRSPHFDSLSAVLGATVALSDNSYLKLSGSYRRAFSSKNDEYSPTIINGQSDPLAGGSISAESDTSDIFTGRAVIGFSF